MPFLNPILLESDLKQIIIFLFFNHCFFTCFPKLQYLIVYSSSPHCLLSLSLCSFFLICLTSSPLSTLRSYFLPFFSFLYIPLRRCSHLVSKLITICTVITAKFIYPDGALPWTLGSYIYLLRCLKRYPNVSCAQLTSWYLLSNLPLLYSLAL